MPPTGPRTRRPEHQGSRTGGAGGGGSSSRPTADRNDVFESIFGRPAGGHHSQAHSTAQTNPSHPPPSQLSYPSYSDQAPRSLQTGYEAFAPPLPPTVDPIAGPSNYGRYQQDGYARSQQATYQSSQNVHGGYGQAAHPPTNNGLLDAYVPTVSSSSPGNDCLVRPLTFTPWCHRALAEPLSHPHQHLPFLLPPTLTVTLPFQTSLKRTRNHADLPTFNTTQNVLGIFQINLHLA